MKNYYGNAICDMLWLMLLDLGGMCSAGIS